MNAKTGTVTIGGKEIKKKSPKKTKNPLGDKAAQADPLAKLGFGIVAYVGLLWCLIWTFILYSLMLYPTMKYFSEGTGFSNVPAIVKSSYLESYLGNMGYSSVQCAQIPSDVKKLSLSCPYGTIGEFLDYGVNPLLENKNTCITNASNLACKPDASFIGSSFASSIG